MRPELLAPAGGYDAALAAFQYGADAVYVGLSQFSARAEADNMTPERLRVLLAYARSFQPAKKVYVAFNTLVPDADLPAALALLEQVDEVAPDGLIVQDLGVARLARDYFPGLELHASTQLAAHNLDGVLALKELGFKRVVLARELSCEEITGLVEKSGVEVEVFIHGALCYSISGLCLFSALTQARSGNRGRCAYCCREGFTCDREKGVRYPFSMKDLALAPLLGKVVATGAHALKIEGRMKSPLYVACLTDYYRKKLDGNLSAPAERQLVQDVQTVFSRPWTTLYAEGRDAAKETIIDPVAIGHRGARIGESDAVLQDGQGRRWLRFKTNRALEKHDGIQVELPGGGKPFGFAVHQMRLTGNPRLVITAPAGASVEIALPEEENPYIPKGTPLFCSASQAVRRAYEIRSVREAELTIGKPVEFEVALSQGGIRVVAIPSHFMKCEGMEEGAVTVFLPLALEKAQQPERTEGAVRKAFERLGGAAWSFGRLTLNDPEGCYAPASKLNEVRRMAIAQLDESWEQRRTERLSMIRRQVATLEAQAVPSRSTREQAGGQSSEQRARRTLKVRAACTFSDVSRAHADLISVCERLVLLLGHEPYGQVRQQLADWQSACPGVEFRLALPFMSREAERQALRTTVRRLIDEGWASWECADLAGWHLLKQQGVTPLCADWSLYVFNRMAAVELARLGFRSFVLSPECDLPAALALAEGALQPEFLVYQQVPLFISETPPCTEQEPSGGDAISFTDRRGRGVSTQEMDSRWITTSAPPLDRRHEASDLPFAATRIDLSWSTDL